VGSVALLLLAGVAVVEDAEDLRLLRGSLRLLRDDDLEDVEVTLALLLKLLLPLLLLLLRMLGGVVVEEVDNLPEEERRFVVLVVVGGGAVEALLSLPRRLA